jgi:hypothetical protein
MRIVIDYDVYAMDPGLWDDHIDNAKARGHEVLCFAQRDEGARIFPTQSPAMLVHYLGSQNKAAYARAHQIRVDVWIEEHEGYA